METATKKKNQIATNFKMMSCCCSCSRTACEATANKVRNKDIETAPRPRRRCRLQCGLAWLPICTSAIGLLTILVTYLFAIGYDHIPPVLPYISDTGVEYPESSIFSLFLDLVAALLITTMYVRYKLIGQFHYNLEEEKCFKRIGRVNRAGLVFGVISAAGLAMLANFPEDENLMAHLMGAFFCFTAGVAYCFLHTWLSFKTSPALSPPFVCFLRLILASFAALTMALLIFFGTALRWHADDCHPQIHYRQISAVFEWLLTLIFNLFFVTFALEFQSVKLSHTFKHYQGGSWVGFTPLPTSEPVTVAEPAIESTSRRPSCHGNPRLKGTCHHSDGSMHMLPVGTICPTNIVTSV